MCTGITSRGSPTLVTSAKITLLNRDCGTSACVVLLGGPNLLDEEAAVKSAMGMSSLTSGAKIQQDLFLHKTRID